MDASYYPENRETGIEWLTSIPSHWDDTFVKFGFDLKLGKMLQPNPASFTDTEVPYLKALHVNWDKISTEDLPLMFASVDEMDKFEVVNGDLLVCEGGEAGRASILKTLKEPAIIQNALHRVRNSKLGKVKYFNYLLRNIAGTGWFDILCNKATIAHLTSEKLGAIRIPFPPIKEQQQIAKFLDYKTGQIDRLIAKKKALIEKLNEKRIGLITQAVTKGLDPSVPMRDSEVEWLGEVPKHWGVRRLKECSMLISKGTTPSTEGLQILSQGEVRFIKAENIVKGSIRNKPSNFINEHTNFVLRRSILQKNDILFVIAGATLGKIAIVNSEHLPANTNQAVAFIRPTPEVNTSYLFYWLQSYLIKEMTWLYAVTSAQPNLAMGVLGNFITLLPSYEEQNQIVDFICLKISETDKMIRATQKTIDRLTEYRTALITDVVTGKIDVRDIKVPEEV